MEFQQPLECIVRQVSPPYLREHPYDPPYHLPEEVARAYPETNEIAILEYFGAFNLNGRRLLFALVYLAKRSEVVFADEHLCRNAHRASVQFVLDPPDKVLRHRRSAP